MKVNTECEVCFYRTRFHDPVYLDNCMICQNNKQTQEYKNDIRRALGQTIFPKITGRRRDQLSKSIKKGMDHKRFDFNAGDDAESIHHNKSIVDIFYSLFENINVVIHSYKGCIYAFIVSNDDYEKYQDKYYNRFMNDSDNELPYLKCINYGGEGTTDIIYNLLMFAERQ